VTAPNTYYAIQKQDADFLALTATALSLSGVAVSTALLLAGGQSVDLNGEAAGLILDAAQVVVLQGATAGHAKLDISGSNVIDVSAAATALTGTLDVTGAATLEAAATVGTTLGVTGILTATGGVVGNLTGGVKETVAAVTADGAIAVPTASKSFFITKAGIAAMTLVDPTATTHDGVRLTFISTTANAHTLDNSAGSGFFSSGGAGKDVATFGGAIGDGIIIEAYQGKWYIVPGGSLNITLG
jgi:hypothetical protein